MPILRKTRPMLAAFKLRNDTEGNDSGGCVLGRARVRVNTWSTSHMIIA